MDETQRNQLDEQLRQLAQVAQHHPARTKERQQALAKLVSIILRTRCLFRPQMSQFPPDVYEEIYGEALQKLLLYFCQNIDRYDPDRSSVIKWLNFLMDKRFIDVVNEYNNKKITYIPNITDLEQFIPSEEAVSMSQELRHYLKEDPDNIFRTTCIKNRPDANFQAIALRYISGKSWKEISSELNIQVSTLSNFYQRCLDRFTPVLKEYLQK